MEDINGLPTEVLSHILSFLEPNSWTVVCEVCRRWYNILQGAHFQRQLMMRIDSTFANPPTEQEKCSLTRCRNLLITQWDESYDFDCYDEDEDEDEVENSEENFHRINVVEFKYLFEPSPEHNAGELLYGQELNLESFELCSTFAGCRYILEDRIQRLQNLTELTLDIEGARVSGPIAKDHTFWVLCHDRIRKLKLSFVQRMNNFSVITPALTFLELHSLTIFSMPIITTYANQLQHVDLKLETPGLINGLFVLKFPLVTHLHLRIDDDREHQEQYIRLPNRLVDIQLDEQFVKCMPKLKCFCCESHVLFYRMASALAKFGHPQLEQVKLDSLHFDAVLLKMLQTLPSLKAFKMRRCKALPLPETLHVLPRLNLPYLEELSLVTNESHIVFDKGLAGLKSLEITIESRQNQKTLYKICNNLPNLVYLRLILSTKLVNTALRYLDRLTKLRSMHVDNVDLNEELWRNCPEMVGVRKLVFIHGNLSMGTVTAIARLFPALKELHHDLCLFDNCAKHIICDDDESIRDQYEERVRQYFPKCRVSFSRSMYMEGSCYDR